MDVTKIPQTLPPAITVSRELVEFCLSQDVQEYGATGPAALAWQWALTGQGPTPVALCEWQQAPPDRDMILDESRWPYGDGWDGRAARTEIERARFILWWLTASPDDEVPARFRHHETGPTPAAVEHGSVTVSLAEVHSSPGRSPYRA